MVYLVAFLQEEKEREQKEVRLAFFTNFSFKKICHKFLNFYADQKQSRELLEGGIIDDDGEHINYLNLNDIMAATNSFSQENKLGEGGFGPVYKVINKQQYD